MATYDGHQLLVTVFSIAAIPRSDVYLTFCQLRGENFW